VARHGVSIALACRTSVSYTHLIPGVTQHMLTVQLRELEADGLITRTVFAEVPPRVEYAMTTATKELEPTILSLLAWWEEFGKSAGACQPAPVPPAHGNRSTRQS